MNDFEELISVVVPVFNVSEYLNACLDSILSQTYTKLEIILVDDGSTDESGRICDEYVKKDSRIKLIRQKNGGLSAARNAGIDIASGKYITFIDSDDYVDSTYISYLYGLLVKDNADISVCQNRKIYSDGSSSQDICLKDDFVIQENDKCMKEFLSSSYIDCAAWAKMYRTVFFEDIRYPEGKYHEDVFTTHRLIGKCKCMSVGKAAKYNYLVRSNSISNKGFEAKHLDSIEGKQQQYAYIKEHFPKCIELAEADIICSVNSVVLKIIDSKYSDEDLIKGLQELYRKHEKSFLRGVSSGKAKIFSVLAYISLRTLINFGEKLNK